MTSEPSRSEAQSRSSRMLRTALGGAIAEWLADPEVIEIMLNPDPEARADAYDLLTEMGVITT